MTISALVPARSGSKRLPGKNVRLLAGRPLVHWTLAACIEAPSIDRVIFSTDSEEYWDGARRAFGEDKLVLDWRDAEEAGDKVKIFDYVKKAWTKLFAETDTAFVLCLPTVPLRTSGQIEDAVARHRDGGRPVFSAVAYGFPVSFAFFESEGHGWTPAFDPSPMVTGNTRSQDQRVAFHPNGAIYVRRVADLADDGLRTFYEDAEPYVMDARSSVDIDNEHDFELAEFYLSRGERRNSGSAIS